MSHQRSVLSAPPVTRVLPSGANVRPRISPELSEPYVNVLSRVQVVASQMPILLDFSLFGSTVASNLPSPLKIESGNGEVDRFDRLHGNFQVKNMHLTRFLGRGDYRDSSIRRNQGPRDRARWNRELSSPPPLFSDPSFLRTSLMPRRSMTLRQQIEWRPTANQILCHRPERMRAFVTYYPRPVLCQSVEHREE